MRYNYFFILIIIFILGGCTLNSPSQPPTTLNSDPSPEQTTEASPTALPASPDTTPTESPTDTETTSVEKLVSNQAVENGEPLAARVNYLPVYLSTYQNQVAQLQQALANTEDTQAMSQIEQQVLSTLIDQAIIEQEAANVGLTISDDTLDAKIQESITQGGGEDQFEAWLATNNLTTDTFKEQLRAELVANQMYEYITKDVAETADQIEMSQILVTDDALAWQIIDQLKGGANFTELVQAHSLDESSRANDGNLGWFPQGLELVPPEVETVAFSIEPGQVSGPIQSPLGFHIIKLENKEADRPLENMQPQVKQQLFIRWLDEQRTQAIVEVYIDF